jgi:hypothetical protein
MTKNEQEHMKLSTGKCVVEPVLNDTKLSKRISDQSGEYKTIPDRIRLLRNKVSHPDMLAKFQLRIRIHSTKLKADLIILGSIH